MLIRSDNSFGGWTQIQDAAAGSQAYAVVAKEFLLPCDVDNEADLTWAEAVVAAVGEIGGSYVQVESGGGPGHYHYWFIGPPGWSTADLAELAKAQPGYPGNQKVRVRKDGLAEYTRPPCSPHRRGGSGRLVHPRRPEEALRVLRGGAIPLSTRIQRLIRDGDTEGRYTRNGTVSRGAAITAIATAYVNARLPFDRLYSDLMHPASVAGQKVRDLGGRGRPWLRGVWEDQRQWVKVNSPASLGLDELAAVVDTAEHHRWTGRGATNESRVYRALVARMVDYGFRTPVVSMDLRSLALICGVKTTTVAAALRRLEAAGLVSIDKPAGRHQARTYRVHPKNVVDRSNVTPLRTGGARETIDPLNDHLQPQVPDLFRGRGGNPPGSYETLLAVPGHWATVKDIATRRAGAVQPRTLLRHLVIFETQGLVERNAVGGHRWRRVPGALERLDQLAERFGVAGKAELQQHQYAEERSAYDHRYHRTSGHTRASADRVVGSANTITGASTRGSAVPPIVVDTTGEGRRHGWPPDA